MKKCRGGELGGGQGVLKPPPKFEGDRFHVAWRHHTANDYFGSFHIVFSTDRVHVAWGHHTANDYFSSFHIVCVVYATFYHCIFSLVSVNLYMPLC